MAEKKLIKKDYFNMLREIVVSMERKDLVDFIDNEIELLNKKSSRTTLTQTQKENEKLKEKIVSTLTELGKYATISEIQQANPELADLSNQKMSALLKQLVDTKTVDKVIEKKKAYFSIASAQRLLFPTKRENKKMLKSVDNKKHI